MSQRLLSWSCQTPWSSCISSLLFTRPRALLNHCVLPSFAQSMTSTWVYCKISYWSVTLFRFSNIESHVTYMMKYVTQKQSFAADEDYQWWLGLPVFHSCVITEYIMESAKTCGISVFLWNMLFAKIARNCFFSHAFWQFYQCSALYFAVKMCKNTNSNTRKSK